MSGRIPEHVIEQIVNATNLASLVGRHCDLKPKGKSLWGCCPFHNEKTPSFKVDPDKGLYYCFGCHESGNVFTWLEKVEGLGFREALERLARDAGIDLSQYSQEDAPPKAEAERLRDVCELAATWYAKCLAKSPKAEHAREYLRKRQINEQSVARWRLGYAPDGWENMLKFAIGRGYGEDTLLEAGLILPRHEAEGCYDRFRDRLMFPVSDRSGRVIGFGARALKDEDEPKYLNSPEGPLFHKGSCFYGIAEAREGVRGARTAVVVEGYTDVIMAHQFGLDNVVAVLGTALTEHHARALRRLCDTAVLVFDPDEAGQNSAVRSIEVLLREDMEVRVATLADGMDPCEFLLARGADEMRAHLDGAEDFLEFRLRRARKAHDMTTRSGRARAFDELAQLALSLPNEARRDMLIRRVAGELGIAEHSAWAYIERTWSRRRRSGKPRAESPGEQPSPAAEDDTNRAAVRELLVVLLEEPDLQQRACDEVDLARMPPCPEKDELERLLATCRKGGPVDAGSFLAAVGDADAVSRVAAALAQKENRDRMPGGRASVQRYEDCLASMERKELRRELEGLILPATPTEPAPAEASDSGPSDDEKMRSYDELRRREDKESARINPHEQLRRREDEESA